MTIFRPNITGGRGDRSLLSPTERAFVPWSRGAVELDSNAVTTVLTKWFQSCGVDKDVSASSLRKLMITEVRAVGKSL